MSIHFRLGIGVLKQFSFFFVAKEGENAWDKVETDGHIVLEEANGYPDSKLIINDVKMEDRAEYMCYAENSLGNSNSTVLVRVIGMLFAQLSIFFRGHIKCPAPSEATSFLFRFSVS